MENVDRLDAATRMGGWIIVLQDFAALCKPKVLLLIMLTAVIGAALAGLHHPIAAVPVMLALSGIACIAAAAAAFNCLVETAIDRKMGRTRGRPLPCARLTRSQAAVFIVLLGGGGMALTVVFGGALTAALTALSFFGYAIVYTLYLKKVTPQNIVIGGASGAMPPLLGWVAVTGEITYAPLLLFLIIFVWTPPHFWALALYRKNDYARANIPMLPVTHGDKFTALQIVLYALMLFAVTTLPYLTQLSSHWYLIAAVLLNLRFVQLSVKLQNSLKPEDGRRLFTYSIVYLALIFLALFLDGCWQLAAAA